MGGLDCGFDHFAALEQLDCGHYAAHFEGRTVEFVEAVELLLVGTAAHELYPRSLTALQQQAAKLPAAQLEPEQVGLEVASTRLLLLLLLQMDQSEPLADVFNLTLPKGLQL